MVTPFVVVGELCAEQDIGLLFGSKIFQEIAPDGPVAPSTPETVAVKVAVVPASAVVGPATVIVGV